MTNATIRKMSEIGILSNSLHDKRDEYVRMEEALEALGTDADNNSQVIEVFKAQNEMLFAEMTRLGDELRGLYLTLYHN